MPGSAPFRLEWRPSRWLLAALLALSLLAPLSVLGSELAPALAWPLALAAAGHGLRLAWTEAGRAPRRLVLAAGGSGTDLLDGKPLRACHVGWRGPLAFVHAIDRDGRSHRLAWWPDTLPAPLRRELRLAMAARMASRRVRPMAP
ncbi:hypothetical protein [Pseudoxanthomonas koreensis]|uniref:hypothetical protein n=1 Tax=Pseudoxanthomonas koreensis TaxID=266061 RepID=UPI001EE4E465|nr:hypothetical protein [Pseudoxanthomonas koreensis]